MKILINNDVFDVVSRLKQIDSNYYVVFDTNKNRFEVMIDGAYKRLCFVVPYESLDCRTIDYALKTSVQNASKIFETIDKNNEKIVNENQNKTKDMCSYKFREIYNYEKLSKQMDIKKSYKNIWV